MKFRVTYAVAASIAWFGLALGMVLTVFNVNPLTTIAPNSLGLNDDGIAGLIGRVVDSLSYFTNLSNLIVAVVLTMLARKSARGGVSWHAVRMDSLVMISITGLIYALVLAPDAQVEGVDIVVNAIKHYIVPALTVVIWLIDILSIPGIDQPSRPCMASVVFIRADAMSGSRSNPALSASRNSSDRCTIERALC